MAKKNKFWALIHPGAPKGVSLVKPKMRKQDKRATGEVCYAVIFFPKITGIGKAHVSFYGLDRSLAQTPQGAKAKFVDSIGRRKGDTDAKIWRTYHDAGHRIRKIRIVDLGEAS